MEVPALKVKFVFVAKATGAAALNVTVELPKLIVRALVVEDDKIVAVTLKLLVVKVPLKTVILVEQVKASPNVTTPPVELLNMVERIVLPPVVNVPVAFISN